MADYSRSYTITTLPAVPTPAITTTENIVQPFTEGSLPGVPSVAILTTENIVKPHSPVLLAVPGFEIEGINATPAWDPNAVFLHDLDVGYTDYTAEAISDADDDVELVPDPIAYQDTLYIGSQKRFYALMVKVTTAGDGTYEVPSIQYYNGSTWTPLTTAGEVELDNYKSADTVFLAWLLQEDWAKVMVNGSTQYWIRLRVDGGTLTTQPLAGKIKLQLSMVAGGQVVIVM